MTIDHIGYLFNFPYALLFRTIGRLAFPMFCFAIAEGCKYTKNHLKHILTLFIFGVVIQVFDYFFNDHSLYMNVFITFTLSDLMIYALKYLKIKCINNESSVKDKLISILIFLGSIAFSFIMCQVITVDYGFVGTLIPVIISLIDFRNCDVSDKFRKIVNSKIVVVITYIIACLVLAVFAPFKIGYGLPVLLRGINIGFFSLISTIFIIFYNGEKGKLKMKYFFYPLHLVLLQVIIWLF